jgi:hemolysin activation/secretion protein
LQENRKVNLKMSRIHSIGKGCLAISIAIATSHGAEVLANANATKPFTASELPVMATTPNLVYGTYGPQTRLDSPTFQTIPTPIYLDKALEAQLDGKNISVDSIETQYNSVLQRDNEVLQETKTLTLHEIKTLAQEKINALKASTGYLCDATVTLKDQKLVIVLTPLMVQSVEVQSNDWQNRVLTHLTKGIALNEPLDLKDVEKKLRLIQVNPDLAFSTELEVLPYTHQVKIKLITSDHKAPVHVVASGNNLDQIIFGRYFGGLTAITNNLTGHGDSLMVAGVRGHRSTGVFTRYEYPINPALRAILEYQIADIAPYDRAYTGNDTSGYAYRISPGIKYVAMDKPDKRLSFDANIDIKQSNTRSGADPIEREVVRTLRAGLNYDQKWAHTTLSMRHEIAAGVPVFGGSLSTDPRLSWYRGGSQYLRYTGYATLARQMKWDSTGSLNLQWQYTPDGLSNFDVGGLGGTFYGRGYREVYLFVDSYAILTAQWQVPAKFLPKSLKLPFSDKPLRDTTQLLTFVDYGYGDVTHAPSTLDGNDHILSAGVGIRSQLTNRISGRFDVAVPMVREMPFSQAPRFHFGIDTVLY